MISMPECSERPLLRGNTISIASVGDYQNLLTIDSDSMTSLHVGHIRLDINDATSIPYVNVFLDGKPYLEDFRMINTAVVFDFGRHVLLKRVTKPIIIQIKKTATGAGALVATAYVDGIEELKY